MTATDDRVVDLFIDAGITCVERGVATDAARSFADTLIAEGHEDALAEITAVFWTRAQGRLARRDRWAAHARELAALDPGEREPPPPPTTPPPPPTTEDPPPPPPEDRADPSAAGSA